MSFSWLCEWCQVATPGTFEGRPWSYRCPNCGRVADGKRVCTGDDDGQRDTLSLIADGEPISFAALTRAAQVEAKGSAGGPRIPTHMPGLEHVIGGGIPKGVAYGLASLPGSGKSTLLVQLFKILAGDTVECLYIQAEEPTRKFGRRYERMAPFPEKHLTFVHERNFDKILKLLGESRPAVAAVDSLSVLESVMDTNDFEFSAGSEHSIMLAARQLTDLAGELDMALFMVVHTDREGAVAGRNTLLHHTDGTLYIEGKIEQHHGRPKIVGADRLISVLGKNRFHSGDLTEERRAHFRMDNDGFYDLGPWRHEWEPWAPPKEANAIVIPGA